jgi:hypothetical protein
VPGFGWANKKPKIKSEKILAKESAKQEKSAEGLKSFVYTLTIMEYFEAQKKGCNEKCAYGRQCLKNVYTLKFHRKISAMLQFWKKNRPSHG